jgi:RNA polymerase sigma factor (TIGR02999 family)
MTSTRRLEPTEPVDPGDSFNQLVPHVYDELRRIAARCLRRREATQPTSLVHEAYLCLVERKQIHIQDRVHFMRLAARVMRHQIADRARRHQAAKRGPTWNRVELENAAFLCAGSADEVLALECALDKLEHLNARQAQVVEMRFFGGLTNEEAAQVLGVSPRTVEGDWRMARAWLRLELTQEG